MVDEPRLDPELAEVERELARFVPRLGKLDHARLMYLAGQASVRPDSARARFGARWVWPSAAAAASLAALTFGVLLLIPAEPQVVEQIVYVERAVEAGPPPIDKQTPAFTQIEMPQLALSPAAPRRARTPHYLIARQRALAYGLDALVDDAPRPVYDAGVPREPTTIRMLRTELLDVAPRNGSPELRSPWWPLLRDLGDTT